MKTPSYETSPGALATLLATRQFSWCGLYKFVFLNGAGTYYYTTADTPVVVSGNTYLTAAQLGALFERVGERALVKWKIGVEVDTLQFAILPNGGTINGQPIAKAIKQGVFDGADVTFSHAYWPLQGYASQILPTGVVTMFAGRVAPIEGGGSKFEVTVNSYLDLLNQQLPKNLYQAGCVNTLGDTGCTVNLAALAVAGTALTGSTQSLISATMAAATGYYDLGKIAFTSGANSGISRGVKQYIKGTPGTIALMSPFPNAIANGDTYNIFPGCDKLQTTCSGKFSNLINFRGEPYIPENSTGV